MSIMRQEAPYPQILADLVDRATYRPGWRITLGDLDRRTRYTGEVNPV